MRQFGGNFRFVLDLNLEKQGADCPNHNLAKYLALMMLEAHGELVLAEERNSHLPKKTNCAIGLSKAALRMAEDTNGEWRGRAGSGEKLAKGQYSAR